VNLKTRAIVTASVVLFSGATFGAVAIGAEPSNLPPTASVPVIGTIDGRTQIRQNGIELKTKSSTKVATFTLTYSPGAYSGWHSHPGIVVAVVKSGTVLRQVGCRTEKFGVDDAFTEVGTHQVSNRGSVDAVLEITQIYPADAPTRRIEQTDPCPWWHPTH
jgi:quercetin dioxygenase-like cupin family protein